MTVEKKQNNDRVAQGHKLAALMKEGKKEILCNKEQSTEQSTVQSTVHSPEQSTVQSNDTYIYDVGILAVLTIGVCIFFTYNKNAGQVIHEQPIKPKRRYTLQI